MKASGGIRTTAEALEYIKLGCQRLGTSNGIDILEGARSAQESY